MKKVNELSKKVFELANELALAGYGNAAVKLHMVHNDLIEGAGWYAENTKTTNP